jgi:phenylpropionate dioxygenase-like ring-hydroxylating dioxygenase large terminal subunit
MLTDRDPPTHHWYVACRSQDVNRKPLARSIHGQPLVLFRDAAQQIGAVLDRCPHRNAPLSQGWVRAGRLVCPYHGWEFDRTGQCRTVPGLCGEALHGTPTVPSYPTFEQDGLVWVYTDLEQPAQVPPRIDLVQTPGYVSLVREFTLEASLLDALENFLDGTHTHFVHAGLVRAASVRRPIRAIVRRGQDWVEAEYVDEGQQSGLISRLFGAGITRTFGRFVLPSTAQLGYWAGDRLKLLITLYFTPQSATTQRVFAVVAGNPAPLPVWLVTLPLKWLFWRVVRQDQRILALQAANLRRFGKPLYLSTELDLLRPHIVRLLQAGRPAPDWTVEKQVTLML